jgi:hypothetical protein
VVELEAVLQLKMVGPVESVDRAKSSLLGLSSMKIHKNSKLFKLPLLREYGAIVLGRHAFFKGEPNEELIEHEMIHQRQMDKHGVIGFYCIYLKDYIKGLVKYGNHWEAYYNIPFEKEAYKEDN